MSKAFLSPSDYAQGSQKGTIVPFQVEREFSKDEEAANARKLHAEAKEKEIKNKKDDFWYNIKYWGVLLFVFVLGVFVGHFNEILYFD